ncbi:hypothetical protein OIU76_005454 [Salix suchowensis]|uniref:Leucine-rich repeat extensin-like protein 3 n=1 Tax=Salix suchowensis TaxID=1278906 RepID=A0ABQ9A9G4_9ROSI|nr:hypothetical protein OIU77_010705 [Salix suchowensis]KAJ6343710.1 hypothetical protein OIU76_005454 [Salix suchowensis]
MMTVMADPMRMLLLTLSTILAFSFSLSPTISEVSKEQIPCTMCYSCDNPCQPLPSPPPPAVPECPPPSPPPPAVPECPPPPPPPSPPPPAVPECPPPPAPANECPACQTPSPPVRPPKPPAGYSFNGPPAGYFFNGPPAEYGNNPVPYFPFDNRNQPLSFSFKSVHLKLQSIVFCIFLSLTVLCF